MPDDRRGVPVELAVIEFPGNQFKGEIVPALVELVEEGIVNILDLVFVSKDADGSITAIEIEELDDDALAAFDALDGDVGGLLSDEDLAAAAEALSPNSSAMFLVWEDAWARRFVDAVVGAGGRLVAHDRLDTETVEAALASAES